MKAWYKKIKTRRGTKIVRVAVMRKRTTILWHMLRWNKPYQFRYDAVLPPKKTRAKRKANKGFQGISNSNHRRKKEKTPLKNKGKTPVKAKA